MDQSVITKETEERLSDRNYFSVMHIIEMLCSKVLTSILVQDRHWNLHQYYIELRNSQLNVLHQDTPLQPGSGSRLAEWCVAEVLVHMTCGKSFSTLIIFVNGCSAVMSFGVGIKIHLLRKVILKRYVIG